MPRADKQHVVDVGVGPGLTLLVESLLGPACIMSNRLSLRHVETIRAVILSGSVTGAATRLHVTQPAISNVLKDAEERLGYHLFDRRGGRLVPTPLADLLFEEIERSFTGLDAINDYCQQIQQTHRRRVSVACTPAFSATVFPEIAKTYSQEHSQVFFSIHSRDAQHVAAIVNSRKADIGFALDVPAVPGVKSEVIGELDLYCYLPALHPLAAHPSLTAEQLCNEPMIRLSRMEGVDDIVDHAFAAVGGTPTPVAECPAAISACAMVAAGLGFTLFDLLPLSLLESSGVVARRFEPRCQLVYRAYWLDSPNPHFDPAPMIALARKALSNTLSSRKPL